MLWVLSGWAVDGVRNEHGHWDSTDCTTLEHENSIMALVLFGFIPGEKMTPVRGKGRMQGYETKSRAQSGTKALFHVRMAVVWTFETAPGCADSNSGWWSRIKGQILALAQRPIKQGQTGPGQGWHNDITELGIIRVISVGLIWSEAMLLLLYAV